MFTKYSSFRLRANTMSPYLPAHCPYAYYDWLRACVRVRVCITLKTMRRLLTMPSRHNRVQHVLFVRLCVCVCEENSRLFFFYYYFLFYSKRSSKSIITSTDAGEVLNIIIIIPNIRLSGGTEGYCCLKW